MWSVFSYRQKDKLGEIKKKQKGALVNNNNTFKLYS